MREDAAVLEQQVKRMLADSRSRTLITNFADQWLFLRNLKNSAPDLQAFPDFDDNLRQAMKQETTLLIDSIMREDRSVLDLLTADYTFVNERLARHYGIPNVYGDQFRRVKAPSQERRGILFVDVVRSVRHLDVAAAGPVPDELATVVEGQRKRASRRRDQQDGTPDARPDVGRLSADVRRWLCAEVPSYSF